MGAHGFVGFPGVHFIQAGAPQLVPEEGAATLNLKEEQVLLRGVDSEEAAVTRRGQGRLPNGGEANTVDQLLRKEYNSIARLTSKETGGRVQTSVPDPGFLAGFKRRQHQTLLDHGLFALKAVRPAFRSFGSVRGAVKGSQVLLVSFGSGSCYKQGRSHLGWFHGYTIPRGLTARRPRQPEHLQGAERSSFWLEKQGGARPRQAPQLGSS